MIAAIIGVIIAIIGIFLTSLTVPEARRLLSLDPTSTPTHLPVIIASPTSIQPTLAPTHPLTVTLDPLTLTNTSTPPPTEEKQSTTAPTEEAGEPATNTPEPTNTSAPPPTETPAPEMDTPTIAPTEDPTDTPTAAPTVAPKSAGIPGLTQADVKLNLEDRGFICSDLDSDEQGGVTYYFRDCSKEDGETKFSVSSISRTIIGVDAIEASIAFLGGRGDDKLAADFLGFVATMPYDGSSPDEARAWVDANIGKVDTGQPAEADFGGVKFFLVGPSTGRILQMGETD